MLLKRLDLRHRFNDLFVYRLEFSGGHTQKYTNYWNVTKLLTEQMGPGMPIETLSCVHRDQVTNWAHGHVAREPVIYIKKSALTMLLLIKDRYDNALTKN
jgi:hypothetical protein